MASSDAKRNRSQLNYQWEIRTDQGPRPENQDRAVAITPDNAALINKKGVLMIVCDGVGGLQGGQKAADAASMAALTAYYDEAAGNEPQQAMRYAIEQANVAVHAEAIQTPAAASMATTIVMTVALGSQLYVANVGDSRAYLFSNGHLEQLSTDHSWVAEQVRLGAMTKEEARHSTMRNLVTRSLGSAANNTPAFSQRAMQVGDRVVLCTDGVHGVVTDDDMALLLKRHPSAGAAADAILAQALENNTADNVTVAVMDYGTVKKTPSFPLVPVLAVLLVLLVIFVGSAILLMGNTFTRPTSTPLPAVGQTNVPSTAVIHVEKNPIASTLPATLSKTLTTTVPTRLSTILTSTLSTAALIPTNIAATSTLAPTPTTAPTRTPAPIRTTVAPTITVTTTVAVTVTLTVTLTETSTKAP